MRRFREIRRVAAITAYPARGAVSAQRLVRGSRSCAASAWVTTGYASAEQFTRTRIDISTATLQKEVHAIVCNVKAFGAHGGLYLSVPEQQIGMVEVCKNHSARYRRTHCGVVAVARSQTDDLRAERPCQA